LSDSGHFNITVLTRDPSTVPSLPRVKAVKADYTDHASLVSILKDAHADAVVVTLGTPPNLLDLETALINASLEAGVKRFIPTEFGIDDRHPTADKIIIIGYKKAVLQRLEAEAKKGTITYTAIATGAFLDWGLASKWLGFDADKKHAEIYNDGNDVVSGTTVPNIAAAIIGTLTNLEGTKNQYLRVSSAHTTQNEVLRAFEAQTGEKWSTSHVVTDEVFEVSKASLLKGEVSYPVIRGLINSAVYTKESAARWPESTDNEKVGIKPVPIEQIVADYLATRK